MTIRFKDGERYKKDAIPTDDRQLGLEISVMLIILLIRIFVGFVAFVIAMEILSDGFINKIIM